MSNSIEIDNDIFATHDRPFADYLEPDGYSELPPKKPTITSFRRCIPLTSAISEKMYASIPNRFRWGLNSIEKGWETRTSGKPAVTKSGGTFIGRPLQLSNIMKHLAGQSGAVGNVDRFVPDDLVQDSETSRSCARKPVVRTLRVDTDMPDARRRHDVGQIQRQISEEQAVAHAFGLPYGVFRSGGKGHQMIVPLPHSLSRAVASFLMIAIKSILTERAEHGTHVDADNLFSIMRLPGGIHAQTRNLGLWIDPGCAALYPIETQAHLMANGLLETLDTSTDIMSSESFKTAVMEVEGYLSRLEVEDHAMLTKSQFAQVTTNLPDNAFVRAYRSEVRNFIVSIASPGLVDEHDTQTDGVDGMEVVVPQDTTWAQAYFAKGYRPGGSYEYLLPKGIRAAMILFGSKDEAERQLIAQARSIQPCPDERIALIERVVTSFDMRSLVARPALLSEVHSRLLDAVRAAVEQTNFKKPKKLKILQIAEVLLLEYQRLVDEVQDDPEFDIPRMIELSPRTIAYRIQSRWTDQRISHVTVHSLMPYLVEEQSAVFVLFRDLGGFQKNHVHMLNLGWEAKTFMKSISHDDSD